jgi:hypothetical protein
MLRFSKATVPAAVVACAAIPAPILQQALAATAGTLFEAAPFVLAVTLVRGSLARWAAALLGCGCGPGAGYAALSLPATALCWTVFGPVPALARFAAAALLQLFAGRSRAAVRPAGSAGCTHAGESAERTDPLEQLGFVGAGAFAIALATSAFANERAAAGLRALSHLSLITAVAESAAGLIAGAIAPCATSAVALAAMLRLPAPLAALGILASAGLVPRFRRPPRAVRALYDARAALVLLGVACALLALRGGSGFVHPRLVPLLWLVLPAVVVAFVAHPTTNARFAALAPCAMLIALVLGSPVPAVPLGSGTIEDLYPGKTLAFTGVASSAAGATTLLRYAITCCRADATAIVLPTNLRLTLPRDTWLTVSGTVANGPGGTYLRATRWQRVAPPADPYVYR